MSHTETANPIKQLRSGPEKPEREVVRQLSGEKDQYITGGEK